MTSVRFDLKELCSLSGVTPRTVHFYIQQGLLPSAGSPGPGAKYDEGHLARLRLIRHLQREHLPLADIRKGLKAMGDGAVRTLASETPMDQPREPSPALDYVRSVLAGSPEVGSTLPERGRKKTSAALGAAPTTAPETGVEFRAAWRALRAWTARSSAAPVAAAPAATRMQATAVAPPPAERSQWDRHILAPDIELHVRRPLTRDQNRRVERLLALARTIFEEELK